MPPPPPLEGAVSHAMICRHSHSCKGEKHHHRRHSPRHRGHSPPPHRSHHPAEKLRVKPLKPSKKVRKLRHKLFKRGLCVPPYHHFPPQLSSQAHYDHPPGCCLHHPAVSMVDGRPLSKERHRPPPHHEMGAGHPRHHVGHHGRLRSKGQHQLPPHEMGHRPHPCHHLGHSHYPHPHSHSPPPRRHAHKRRLLHSSIRSEIVGAVSPPCHLPPLCPLPTSAAELSIDTGRPPAPAAILTGDEAAPSALAP